jgi:hypothetical protein
MNIFYLSPDPKECAEMHLDKHVTKMVIEYAQLLSTAHRVIDGIDSTEITASGRKYKRWIMPDERESVLYKSCHINHPSAKWARANSLHYEWLYALFRDLCDEYTHRYGRVHMTDQKLRLALSEVPSKIDRSKPFEGPWLAMPDDVKIIGDSLASYRNYYIKNKKSFAKWTKRPVPAWFVVN